MNNKSLYNEGQSKNVLILGGADGIGQAIGKIYEKSNYNVHITSRNYHTNLNSTKYYILEATEENSWLEFKKLISKENLKFDIIINTIGILHDEENNIYPEKSIKNLDTNFFMRNIEINTLVSALCLKHLIDFITKNKKVVIANLTARLGSISDNNIGGWLSYRASKAAQHMIIKTASIEFSRSFKRLVIIGLHPGTVSTKLSAPFLKPESKAFTPRESALKITEIIDNLKTTDTGKVLDYAGKSISF